MFKEEKKKKRTPSSPWANHFTFFEERRNEKMKEGNCWKEFKTKLSAGNIKADVPAITISDSPLTAAKKTGTV